MNNINDEGKNKGFFKRMGKTALSIIAYFAVTIPAFIFIMILIVYISIKLPTHGMGKISFLITSGVVFVGLVVALSYINMKKKKLFKNLYFWIFFFAIPVIGNISIQAITYKDIHHRNDILRRDIKKNIGITSASDFYKVPDHENARHLLKIKESIPEDKRKTVKKIIDLFFQDKSSFDSLKNVEEVISPYVSLLDSFYEYDYFQNSWPGDYEDSVVMMPIPDLVFIVDIAKTGIISASIDIEKDRYDKAYQKMLKLWHLRNIVASEPQLICGMVSTVICGLIIEELTKGVKIGWINRTEMHFLVNKIYTDVENYDPIIPAKPEMINGKIHRASGINFEICFMMKWWKRYSKGTSLSWKLTNLSSYYKKSDWDLLFLDTPLFASLSSGAFFDFVVILFPDSLSTWQDYLEYYYKNEANTKIEKYTDRLLDNPVPYYCANIGMLNLEGILNRETTMITRVRILKSASELEKLKQKIGKYPSDFNEMLIDPFTGKNLIYKTDIKGYKIYSVGKNLKDDGSKEDDIVFEK